MHENIFKKNHYLLSEAAELWVQSQKNYWKPGTYTVYTQHLTKYILPYFGSMKLKKITEEVITGFASHLAAPSGQSPLSENYISQICGTVRRILYYMERKFHCDLSVPSNPVVKKRARQMILPDEKSLQLLERYLLRHCEEDTCLGILIAFHTGIRIGELSALTWHDIDLKEGLIYIRKNLLRVKEEHTDDAGHNMTHIVNQSPKTSDSMRIVPVPEKLMPLLQKQKKKPDTYVVSGVKNPWAEPRTIQYRFKNILEKNGIEYFNFHMLRHAFATRCVSVGLDIKSLSEILGHSNIQITLNLYVHTTIQQKKIFMRQYSSFFQSTSQSL